MRKKKIFAAAIALVMACGALSGCGSESDKTSSAVQAKDALVFSIGSTSCDGNFDPIKRWGKCYDFFHTGLMKIDQNLSVQPDLAESYELSEDNLVYTFHLRDGVKFSDGSPFTAKDVVFTYEKAKAGGVSLDLTMLDKVEAMDDHTVVMTLSRPHSPFLVNTAYLGIVCSEKYDENYARHPIGTGRYKLVQLNQDQQMILEANEYYYGTKPKFKKVTVLSKDDNVVMAALQAGNVDMACVPANQAGQQIPGYHIVVCDTMVSKFINLPTTPERTLENGRKVGNDVTADPAIRQALNIGINRQQIVEHVLNGYGAPSYYMLESCPWGNKQPTARDNRFDEACVLLDAAGWKDTDGDGIREKNGRKAVFTINGSSSETERYNIAVALAQQAKHLGIQINVVSTAWADCKAQSGTTPTVYATGNYEPMDIYRYYYTKAAGVSYYNPSYYSNPIVDYYIDQAMQAAPAKALEWWQKAQYDGSTGTNIDIPYLSLTHGQDVYYVRDGLSLGNQRIHDIGMAGLSAIYNIEEWKYE